MIPPKLKEGDHIRIIAPSHSIPPSFSDEMKEQAVQGLEKLGLKVSFGKHIYENNEFQTTTIENRLEDLHDAFADPEVKAVLPASGGSSVNQLLKYIDYELIKNNPKIFCGLSDITAISYALYAKTNVVNYYGPHFTMLGQSRSVEYSFDLMRKALFTEDVIRIEPSEYYNNSPGENDLILNEGYWTIQEGEAEGKSIAGNFLTTNFTLGSEYMPDVSNTIFFLEENHIMDHKDIQNELQSILNQVDPREIKGLVIGRFQRETGVTRELLTKMVKSKRELKEIPVLGNVDFGHTSPMLTIPVGGKVRLEAHSDEDIKIEIVEH